MFEVETGLIFWTALSFLIMVFLLYKYVFPPLNQVIKQRRAAIEERLEEAKRAQSEAQQLLRKYQDQLIDSEKKTLQMFEEARRQSETVKDEALKRAQKAAFQITEEAKSDIELYKKKAMVDLKKDIADVVVDVTQKLIKKKLTARDQVGLIGASIKELEKNAKRKI
jgi:F-type H+-transporting ATPase subunit b